MWAVQLRAADITERLKDMALSSKRVSGVDVVLFVPPPAAAAAAAVVVVIVVVVVVIVDDDDYNAVVGSYLVHIAVPMPTLQRQLAEATRLLVEGADASKARGWFDDKVETE